MDRSATIDANVSGGSAAAAHDADPLSVDLGAGTFAKRGRPSYTDGSSAKKARGPTDVPSDSEADKGDGGDMHKGSCHQCKSRRSIGDLIFCTNIVDKKNKHCRKKYCEGCLKKFYKEDVTDAMRTSWTCPSCRQSCTCAACRRRRDGKDTPLLIPGGVHGAGTADAVGFDSQPGGAAGGLYSSLMMRGAGPDSVLAGAGPYGHLASYAQAGAGAPNGGQNSSFAMLYAVAQMPHVRAQIKSVLDRKDINDENKVDKIAALLRQAVDTAPADGGDASANQSTPSSPQPPQASLDATSYAMPDGNAESCLQDAA